MARKRVPLVLFDDEPAPRKPAKAPPPPPQKPTGKAPGKPATGRKAPPPPPSPAPVPKAPQAKVDLKQAVAALAKPNPIVVDAPYVHPPGTRGAKGPVPPAPTLKPKPPPEGTKLWLFESGRAEIQYKGRVRVIHNEREGTVVIEEYRPQYPEMEEPKPVPASVAQKIGIGARPAMVKKGGRK